MDHYTVTGMSCAACQSRVEKAVSKVPGVESCSVSLLTGSMAVTGTAGEAEIVKAVENAGYKAERRRREAQSRKDAAEGESEALADHETPVLLRRFLASLGFLLVLMYLSMGHMMFHFPIPAFLEQKPYLIGLIEMLLSGIVLIINGKFFVSGVRAVLHRSPNMDTLIALGSGTSFLYSLCVLATMIEAFGMGNDSRYMGLMNELYFESAAMIVTLITLGKMLEAKSKGKTTDALRRLYDLAPKKAVVIRNGREEEIPADELLQGDLFLVRPGMSFPADGVVESGSGAVDESVITGESIPVDKAPDDAVTSATKNLSGLLTCRAVRVGEDTTLSEIISMVSDAATGKAPVQRIADRISGIFVPAVLGIAALTVLLWLVDGENLGFALARGICVLVVSCPCALGLATPVAIMVGNGVGAKNGILFKTAEALQEAGRVKVVALDKTGTITKGKPVVRNVVPAGSADFKTDSDSMGTDSGFERIDPEGAGTDSAGLKLLLLGGVLEYGSEHPLGVSIREEAERVFGPEVLSRYSLTGFQVFPGGGLCGRVEAEKLMKEVSALGDDNGCKTDAEGSLGAYLRGRELSGGNEDFLKSRGILLPESLSQKAEELADLGQTPLFFACDREVCGLISVADAVKEDSREAIEHFHEMGLKVVMLTGDNERTANAVAKSLEIDRVYSGVKPGEKASIIEELKAEGKVAMVGDGINDAPALTCADIGIAIGAGTDVAIDAADVVLMKNSPVDCASAIRLSKASFRIILENLFWALFYNVLLIPVAAGAFSKLFGLTMHPMLGAAAMSLSSFCVVSNALRLNRVKLYPRKSSFENSETKKKVPHAKEQDERKEQKEKTEPIEQKEPIEPKEQTEQKEKENTTMTKTLKITGMMCMHCEARVKKVLEALDGVEAAEVSHEKGTAVVILKAEVADEVLKKAVEDQDYTVTGIE